MLGPLIVSFDHATRDGVVEGSIAVSDLDDTEVGVGCTIGVVDSGAGPYEAEVIAVDGDRIRVRAPALTVPRSRPGLADAEDIEKWAGTHKARSELPQLVRRLLSDTPGVTGLSIQAGRAVDFPHWDGRVDGGAGSPYIPPGLSCWEMSTASDPRGEAQRDYRKRTDNPEGVDPSETTFVFVTPRRWRDKDEWESSRRAERKWRDVRISDADDLAGWLESRFGVHVWFSELIGLIPREVETLERWWSRWSSATDPSLPVDLLLGGRTGQAEELRNNVDGAPSVVGIRAGSRHEATAFVAAVFHTSEGIDHYSRSFVVASAIAWDNSVLTHGRSVLIPTFDGADVVDALSAGHHVVVPMGVDDPGQAIELPRIGRLEAQAAFESIGIESGKAGHFAVRARRSLTSLRRALSVNPRVARPGWAQGPDADVLALLVLVGEWSDNRDSDEKMVSEIVNWDYELIERLLRRWEKSEDPPFRRSGNSWRLANPEDAWTLLNDRIIRDDLERWSNAVLKVLGTRDPVLDLDPQGRFMASVRGEEQRWSFDLRRGLAQGVALLAALDLPRPVGGLTGTDHAESLVRELLARAGNDAMGKLWKQLSDVLTLLAEAAPEAFLEAVRRDSLGEDPLIHNMFTDRPDLRSPWNETSAHTGLVWALETVSWASEYLPEAVEALVRLGEIDPEGRLANRPIDSATNLLLLWRPQTGASLDRRVRVLRGLVERHERVGQDISLGLLSRSSMSLRAAEPRFRDWVPDHSPQASVGDFEKSVRKVADRALAVAGKSPRSLVRWIEELPSLLPAAQKTVISLLQEFDMDELTDRDRQYLWEALDSLLNKYSDRETLEKWLGGDGVEALDALLVKIRPRDVETQPTVEVSEKAALFGWDPARADERQEVIVSFYHSGGLHSLIELTERADNVAMVGITAADVLEDSELLKLLYLMSISTCDHELAMSWIRRRAETEGIAWTEDMACRLKGLRDEVQALFFRSISPDPDVWKLVELQERSIREIYWATLNEFTVSSSDVSTLVSYLLEYNRPWLAVRTVTFGLKKGDSPPVSIDKVERILNMLLLTRSRQILNSSYAYHVGKLLEVVANEKPDSSVLLTSELTLFRCLPTAGYSPSAVYRRLEADPGLFVDLVCLVNSHKTVMVDTAAVSRDVAWSVVHGAQFFPGRETDTGRINSARLHDWVVEARRLFEDRQQTELGDLYIGEILARIPKGSDGVWPAEEVRRLLDQVGTDEFDRGLVMGAFGGRGVVVRDPYEGGRQERELAEQYRCWAEEVDAEWPRTGRVLRQLANLYERDAAREDERAERLADLE